MQNNKGYYNATKTGYHADAADAWTSGTKTFDERQSYLAQDVCDTSGTNDRNFSSTPSLTGELRSGCNAKCAKKIRADYHVCDVANNCLDFSEEYAF